MPEAIVPSSEVIDKLLGMLRARMEEALRQGQKIEAHALVGMKQQAWQPGEANIKKEEDGSFEFRLYIEGKRK